MDFGVFLITFGTLFLGELGDKTQLIVFNLALEHEKSYKVGIGATLGFALIVTLGVFVGEVITAYIPLSLISVISGIVFIVIGVLEARKLKELYLERKELKESDNLEKNVESDTVKIDLETNGKFGKLKKNPYVAGFSFIFLMELGDKTQILTITLASIYSLPIEVWLGSFLALISLAWMGVFFGAAISRKVPKFHLKLASVVIFIVIGILILVTSF